MILNRLAVVCIRLVASFFRYLAPRACRFHPSCSRYAAEAFGSYGFFRASALTAARVGRCHPFSAGGWDPIPAGKAA